MEVVPVGKAAFTDYSDSCFSRWNWSGLRNIDIERLNYYDDSDLIMLLLAVWGYIT